MPFVYPSVRSTTELAAMLAAPGPEGPINRIQIERSDTGGGVGYAHVTTITLLADTLTYTFLDVNGDNGDWYRWYFSNAADTFPGVANRTYSPEIQPSDPGAGLLCDLGDVKQRVGNKATDTGADELLLEIIGQVSTDIMGYTGRRFARNPAAGSTTFYEDVETSGRVLWVPRGIAAATVLEVATSSQPASGGTFTTVPVTEWFLRPVASRSDIGTSTRFEISDLSGSYFTEGYNTVRWTGAEGWATVPADIRGIATRATVRYYQSRGSGIIQAQGSDDFAGRLLPGMPADDARKLTWYRVVSFG